MCVCWRFRQDSTHPSRNGAMMLRRRKTGPWIHVLYIICVGYMKSTTKDALEEGLKMIQPMTFLVLNGWFLTLKTLQKYSNSLFHH